MSVVLVWLCVLLPLLRMLPGGLDNPACEWSEEVVANLLQDVTDSESLKATRLDNAKAIVQAHEEETDKKAQGRKRDRGHPAGRHGSRTGDG